jgi:hypothetical protein
MGLGHGNNFDLQQVLAQVQEKVPSWIHIPFAQPPTYRYVHHSTPAKFVDFKSPSLWLSIGMIFFNPIFWNFVARNGG